MKSIKELDENPLLGKRMGHKWGNDLTGFLKIYVAAKKYNIVYRIQSPRKIEVVEIWKIDKREKEEIFRVIGKRLRHSPSGKPKL